MFIEEFIKLGMPRRQAEILWKLYDGEKKHGFSAEDLEADIDDLETLRAAGYIRIVNIGKTAGRGRSVKMFPLYQANDLFKVLENILAEKLKMFKAEEKLIKLIKRGLDTVKINKCRPPENRIGRPPRNATSRKKYIKRKKKLGFGNKKVTPAERAKREHDEKVRVLREFREEERIRKLVENRTNNTDGEFN